MRVLVVEDDAMLSAGLQRALEDAGMTADCVADGRLAEEAIRNGGHAAVLMDLGLPGVEGIILLTETRKRGLTVPLIVITARDDLEVRLQALDLGADDFILKPFEVSELLARVRAVVRRHSGSATSRIVAGDITLDLASREVTYLGRQEVLPYREFALMRALIDRPGTVLSRAQIEEKVYGWGEEVESNAIEVLIFYVRRRFGKEIIRNVRGAGWMVLKS